MNPIMSLRTALPAVALLSLMACAGDPTPVAPSASEPEPVATATEATPIGLVTCQGSVATGSINCGDAPASDTSGPANVLLGGKNVYVEMGPTSCAGCYNSGTERFTFNMTLKNLTAQWLGTADAGSAHSEGIRVALVNTTVTAGSGSITAYAPSVSGTGTFTGANQSYWQLAGNLPPNSTSSAISVALNVPSTVTTFTFQMVVSTTIPHESGILRWQSAGSLGGTGRGVSCPSTTDCVVVGDAGFIRRWDGTSWTAHTSGTEQQLTDVSCPTASFCVAVGGGGVIRHGGSGTSWTTVTNPQGSNSLTGVSCTSTTHCVAVGTGGVILVWDGTSWSQATSPGSDNLEGVSCASTSWCVAVGPLTGAYRWNGTDWATQSMGTPNGPPGGIYGVHCTSSSFCMAVGYRELRRWNGTQWVNPSGTTGGTGDNGRDWRDWLSVHCANANACVAVGLHGLHGWDGNRWTTLVNRAEITSGTLNNHAFGVFCSTATTCMIVAGNATRSTR
jgi:hypothetical protein